MAAENDPMIPPGAIRPALAAGGWRASLPLTVRWAERGGHLAFARDLDLGQGGALGLDQQVLRWVLDQGERVET